MKNYIIVLFALLAFSSCEEYVNSAEESVPTYLPKFEIAGEKKINLDCSPSGGFDDPGATATESGSEIPVTTSIGGLYFAASTLDGPDIYSVNYSAVNVDGIPGVASRQIYWPACTGDFVTSISGMYTAAVFRTRISDGATVNYSEEEFGPYWVRDAGGGKYEFSDCIGGFYDYGYGYGYEIACNGMEVTVNNIATNDVTISGVPAVGYFGGDVAITKFKMDPVAKTISWSGEWTDYGYIFDVVLTQVDPTEFDL
ncbi:MAG: BT_2262 family domain-containing protein [Bacteroidota bacterium]